MLPFCLYADVHALQKGNLRLVQERYTIRVKSKELLTAKVNFKPTLKKKRYHLKYHVLYPINAIYNNLNTYFSGSSSTTSPSL